MMPGYLGMASRSMACVTAALIVGCSGIAPRVEYVGGPDVGARALPPSPPVVVAETSDAEVVELAAKYYGIEAKVEGLVADVEALDEGQTALQMDLRAVEGRLGSAESRILALSDTIMSRFDSFEGQVIDLRSAMERVTAPAASAPATMKNADRPENAEVIAAVRDWGVAWQNGAVAEYMSWYHPEASVTRVSVVSSGSRTKDALDPAKLRARVARLRARYTRVSVGIQDVEVTAEGERMVARFRQDFTAWAGDPKAKPSYADTGTKTLVFVRVDGDWRVIEESWAPTI